MACTSDNSATFTPLSAPQAPVDVSSHHVRSHGRPPRRSWVRCFRPASSVDHTTSSPKSTPRDEGPSASCTRSTTRHTSSPSSASNTAPMSTAHVKTPWISPVQDQMNSLAVPPGPAAAWLRGLCVGPRHLTRASRRCHPDQRLQHGVLLLGAELAIHGGDLQHPWIVATGMTVDRGSTTAVSDPPTAHSLAGTAGPQRTIKEL